MRLHTLSLTAFGPFPGTETINFDEYDNAGILLIHGPTGSGKTSLLDAVAFALFGQVPGSRHGLRDSLRSHHAAPGVAAEVSLEFSVATTRWRIVRTPAWEAPKKRGGGTTSRQATVLLTKWVEGQWEVVSTRIPEAAEVVSDLLGMQLQQFAQVVLLPQGEFAQFLRAKPEDRRELLERLFDVGRFDHIEEWFTKRKNELAENVTTLETRLRTHTSFFSDTLERLNSDAVVAPDWELVPPEELTDRLRLILGQVRTGKDAAKREARSFAGYARGAERALDSARTILERQRSYSDALDTLERVSARQLAEDRNRLDRARAANWVMSREQKRASAQQHWAACNDRHTSAQDRLRDLLNVDELPHGWRAASEQERDALGIAISQVERALSDEKSVNATREGMRKATQARERSAQEVAEAAQAVKDADTHLEAAITALESVAEPAELEKCFAQWLRLAEQVREATKAHAHAREVERTAASAVVEAETAELQLRSQRLANFAATLALELEDNRPCPVCGGTEHPAPATPGPDSPSDHALEQAEKATATSRRKHTAANGRRATTSAELESARLRHDEASDELAQRLAGAAVDLSDEHSVRTHVEDVRREYAVTSKALEAAQDASTAAHERVRNAQVREASAAAALDAAIAAHEGACERFAQSQDSLVALVEWDGPSADLAGEQLQLLQQQLPQRRRHIDELLCLDDERERLSLSVSEAAKRLESAQLDLDDQLVALHFEDVDDARQHALDDHAVASLREKVEEQTQRRSSASAITKDRLTLIAAHSPAPSVEALAARDAWWASQSAAKSEEAARWVTAFEALEGMRDTVADLVDSYLPKAQQAKAMADLAATFSGGGENTKRMRLTSYVLAAYLENITALANLRLAQMGDGRYQLRHTDSLAARGARSGLGLAVVDSWTGQTRDTATLSGGEAFMASLALALGLGDAVRADTGGIELHTLFVDEGFGSLDPDTLEEVMQVLDALRDGGRLVGIVSHVTELKARIPTRIEVRKTSEGSTVKKLDPNGVD